MLHQGARCRVVLINDSLYPGFCRVIWHDHVKEATDLGESDRLLLMEVVWQVERVVRDVMQPEKINLASFNVLFYLFISPLSFISLLVF